MGKNAKQLLKDATWELVLNQGFKATKVQDICKEAGVSKMTFYYYYKNKHDIIEEVLLKFFDDAIDSSTAIMNKEVPFHDKIMELVHWKAEFVKSMSPKFVQELYVEGGKYVDLMKDVMQRTTRLTYEFYRDGKEKGEINRTVDVKVIMFWMNIVSDMIIEGKFNHLFDDPKEMNRQIRDLMLYGVLGNREEEDYHDLTMF
jgi:AcrR family transcriptional regulator